MPATEKYIALYSRHKNFGTYNASTLSEAREFLEQSSAEGNIMDIAIIDIQTKRMVWFKEYLGEEECQQNVDTFLSEELSTVTK